MEFGYVETCPLWIEIIFLVEAIKNTLLFSLGVGKFFVIWFHKFFSLSFMDLLGFMFHFLSFTTQLSLTDWSLACDRAYNLGYLRERMSSWLQFECQNDIWSPLLIFHPWLSLYQLRFSMIEPQEAFQVLNLPIVGIFPMWAFGTILNHRLT